MDKINRNIIKHVKKTVEEIEKSLFPTLKEVFDRYQGVIKEYNTEEQLYNNSIDSKGLTIQPSYAQSTVNYKRKKGQISIRVTLKDTGDFYESVQIIPQDDKLIIETSIEYAKYLTKKYGKDILGVTDENLETFYKKYISQEIEHKTDEIISKNKL